MRASRPNPNRQRVRTKRTLAWHGTRPGFSRAPARNSKTNPSGRSLPLPEEWMGIFKDLGPVVDRETGFTMQPADKRIFGDELSNTARGVAVRTGRPLFPVPGFIQEAQLPGEKLLRVDQAAAGAREKGREPSLKHFPDFKLVALDGDRTLWDGVLGVYWHEFLDGMGIYSFQTKYFRIAPGHLLNKIRGRDLIQRHQEAAKILEGVRLQLVTETIAPAFFERVLMSEEFNQPTPFFFPKAVELTRGYRDPLILQILASGSHHLALPPVARHFGIDVSIGAHTKVGKDGIISGNMERPLCLYAGKPVLVDSWLRFALIDALEKYLGRKPTADEVNTQVEKMTKRADIYTDDLRLDQFFARFLGQDGNIVITNYAWELEEEVQAEVASSGLQVARFDGGVKPESIKDWKKADEAKTAARKKIAAREGRKFAKELKG